jgi:uncharacterized protein (DUF1778 family)
MPQMPVDDNRRMSLRIPPAEKALLMRAITLKRTSLTDFVIRTAVAAAREIIEQAERVQLSERDSLRALELLENPPPANEKLRAAARALPGPS